jgi:hypothetical protein
MLCSPDRFVCSEHCSRTQLRTGLMRAVEGRGKDVGEIVTLAVIRLTFTNL